MAPGTITTSYSLAISAPGADSGLDDAATGQNVLLSVNGGVVEGRTGGQQRPGVHRRVNPSGTVTLDQVRAVVHPNTEPG